jgi:hypothetical protein
VFRILLALPHPADCIAFLFPRRLDGFVDALLIVEASSQGPTVQTLLALLTLSYRGLALAELLTELVNLAQIIALLERDISSGILAVLVLI